MPPLHVKKGQVTELEKGGLALGIHQDASYKEEKIKVETDDVIILYSDGLTEAKNKHDIFYGDQRLHKLLGDIYQKSAESIGNAILKSVESFVLKASQNDDLTLAILKKNK